MLNLGVTCYSYQDEIRLGRMTWEDVLAHAASIGAHGFEIVPEQFLTDVEYELIPADLVARWKDQVQKYDLVPTNCNLYDDFDVYPNRILTDDERFDRMRHGIKLAKTLGFRSVRGCADLPPALLERIIKLAEDNGIIISLEVHAPFSLKSDWMQTWFDMIERTGTKYAGIHPDGAIFSRAPRVSAVAQAVRRGAKPEIIEYLTKEGFPNAVARRAKEREILRFGAYADTKGYDYDAMHEKVLEMGGGPAEERLFSRLACDDPAWLLECKKYIVHFHGKFYDMVDDGQGGFYDPSIDYEGIVKALVEIGYTGYISSEYEGMGAYHDFDCPTDAPSAADMITKQHTMIRSYEAKYAK